MSVLVKICGLSTEEAVTASLDAGADMIGLVFFPPSPRNVSLQRAARLAELARRDGDAAIVALTVDADDDLVDAVAARLRPDLLQLHGREPPGRVDRLRARTGIPVMKAIGIGSRSDLAAIERYRPVCDRILLDARPAPDADLPGGNGLAFDWSLLEGVDLDARFMLSGGLDPATVAQALDRTGTRGVDVSSGVESAPGVKDPQLIADFVAAVRRARPEGDSR